MYSKRVNKLSKNHNTVEPVYFHRLGTSLHCYASREVKYNGRDLVE